MPGTEDESFGEGGFCAGDRVASALTSDPELVGDGVDPSTDDSAASPGPVALLPEGCARMDRASPGFAMARGNSRSPVSGRGACGGAIVGRPPDVACGETGVAG
ncbi:MAG: hypothetical protein ACR2LG_08880 [Actinomycetota bacterium]